MINVFHIVSNKQWTGAEQYTYDLVERLRNDPDFYVEVVCRKHPNVLKQYRRLEIPISILPLKGVTDIDSPVRFARLLRKGRNIIHFAASKKHIGIYPGGEATEVFAEELSGYDVSKGTIRIPYDDELPEELLRKIAAWCFEKYKK